MEGFSALLERLFELVATTSAASRRSKMGEVDVTKESALGSFVASFAGAYEHEGVAPADDGVAARASAVLVGAPIPEEESDFAAHSEGLGFTLSSVTRLPAGEVRAYAVLEGSDVQNARALMLPDPGWLFLIEANNRADADFMESLLMAYLEEHPPTSD